MKKFLLFLPQTSHWYRRGVIQPHPQVAFPGRDFGRWAMGKNLFLRKKKNNFQIVFFLNGELSRKGTDTHTQRRRRLADWWVCLRRQSSVTRSPMPGFSPAWAGLCDAEWGWRTLSGSEVLFLPVSFKEHRGSSVCACRRANDRRCGTDPCQRCGERLGEAVRGLAKVCLAPYPKSSCGWWKGVLREGKTQLQSVLLPLY